MTAEPSIRERQQEASAASRSFADELERRRLLREGWSEECLDSERRFGSRVARLYPLVRHEVDGRTTNENAVTVEGIGPASLLRVFADTPGRPGAMVLPLRPRAFIEEVKHGKKTERAAAVFVAIDDVKPYRKEKR